MSAREDYKERVSRRALLIALLPLGGAAHAADPAQAPALAELYGYTLGAAAGCPAVGPQRIDQAAALATRHLTQVAGSEEGANQAAGRLAAGIAQGKRDITSGVITCAQAESELANLEHELSP